LQDNEVAQGVHKHMAEADPIVDWSVFTRTRSELGPGFIRILGYFREDGEKSVAKIEDAMRNRDAAALVIPAHTLKSEARQFGADPLGELAEEIEFAARRGIEGRIFPITCCPWSPNSGPCTSTRLPCWSRRSNPLASAVPPLGRGGAGSSETGRM
jgi:hypothetical protein